MTTPVEAERLVFGAIRPWGDEPCPLSQARGRVLRRDIMADRDLPPFDRATMDGYALRAAALASGARRFRVAALQPAGAPAIRLAEAADACVEIATGAVLPEGADCVVPYEAAVRDGEVVRVDAADGLGPGHAVHPRASDRRTGEVLVSAGARLSGREIAVAAACGCSTLTVARRPRLAVVATGDELVEVGEPVAPHQIRRSNDLALCAALAAAEFPGAERFLARDREDEVEHLLWHLIAEYDVLVLTGGVSKGKFDFLPAELTRQGVRALVQGVAQRPGKPFWFGISARQTPVFALPGNPVSSYACLHRYVIPALDRASGAEPRARRLATLAEPYRTGGRLAALLPVAVSGGPGGELRARPRPGNTSGDFAGLVGTDGFVELPAGPESYPEGHMAPFYPWF